MAFGPRVLTNLTLADLLQAQAQGEDPYGPGQLPEGGAGNFLLNNSTGQRIDLGMSQPPMDQRLLPDYTRPVEVAGSGKGYWTKGDPFKIAMADGTMVDMGIDPEASRARTKENLAMEKARLDNEFLQAKIRGEVGSKGGSNTPHLTEVVDPRNSRQMLRVNANVYRGGTVGDPGVIGVSGKEIKQETALQKKLAAQQDFEAEVDYMTGLYDQLQKEKAIPSTTRGTLSNLVSSMQSSAPGQFLGQIAGTEEQAQRNQIRDAKMRLAQAVRKATEAGVSGMNSDLELRSMLNSLGDPSRGYEASISTLQQLRNRFGKHVLASEDGGMGETAPAAPTPTQSPNSTFTQESLFNARRAIARNPGKREAIIQKLRENGIDPRGL